MDGDRTGVGIGEVLLAASNELSDDRVGRRGSVREDHILMVNPLLQEGGTIVLGFVESDDLANVEVLEDVDVAGSCVAVTVHGVSLVNGSHKGQELARDDPVEISVLHLLVVLVLSRIESLEIVPSKSDCVLKALQAVLDGALVLAGAAARIPVVVQVGLILLEELEGGPGVHLQDHDHEGTHQVGRVGQFGEIGRSCVVVDAGRPLEALRLEQLLKLTAESMSHR